MLFGVLLRSNARPCGRWMIKSSSWHSGPVVEILRSSLNLRCKYFNVLLAVELLKGSMMCSGLLEDVLSE
eukprot:6162960-Amphidinium_carterae.1